MKRNWTLIIGSGFFIFLVLITLVGPYLPFIDTVLESKRVVFTDSGVETAPFEPSRDFLFGSDKEGRDLLSIIVVGAKETLGLILAVAILRYFIAIVLALLSVNKKGAAHWILQGWNQIFSALPVIFSAIILLSLPIIFFHEHRFFWAIVILASIEVGRVGTVLQSQFHSIKNTPYVEAGITVGVSSITLFSKYFIPNALPDLVVQFFLDMGRIALLIGQLGIFSIFITQQFVQLSYGSGIIENTSLNWATLLGQARGDLLRAFWIPFFPALALAFSVLTFNVLGEGLRKHFHRLEA
ncbi:ABC transporter permease [Bacillus sp. LL01]|uniref:ABC transporter permease n=1 Tax=Bacillus sp. LL01 TaxID=1665556 RepID=UPI00064D4D28|nr:ABC transporter permease subunit [Bacillus sp. LL01]KMJ58228.1 ABC transporter permease [Bacillus sp. LL01]